jgi:RNA polymerase sigma-70 factor, ECF subfamily
MPKSHYSKVNSPGPSDPGGAHRTGSDRQTRRVGQESASDDARSRCCAAFAPILRDVVRRRQGGALDREDAAQEAWLFFMARVVTDRAGDGGDDPSPQFAVRIRNHLADLGRLARRHGCLPLADEEADVLVGRELDPAEAYEVCRIRQEVRAALVAAREFMTEPTHRIVVLRWIEGRSYAEIAEILEMTVARVRDRHRRALPALRALLIRRFGTDLSVLPTANPDTALLTPQYDEVTP